MDMRHKLLISGITFCQQLFKSVTRPSSIRHAKLFTLCECQSVTVLQCSIGKKNLNRNVSTKSLFIDEPVGMVTKSEIKNFLRSSQIPAKEGHTCYIIQPCPLCFHSLRNDNIGILYINMFTGWFSCNSCSHNGDWEDFVEFIDAIELSKSSSQKRKVPENGDVSRKAARCSAQQVAAILDSDDEETLGFDKDYPSDELETDSDDNVDNDNDSENDSDNENPVDRLPEDLKIKIPFETANPENIYTSGDLYDQYRNAKKLTELSNKDFKTVLSDFNIKGLTLESLASSDFRYTEENALMIPMYNGKKKIGAIRKLFPDNVNRSSKHITEPRQIHDSLFGWQSVSETDKEIIITDDPFDMVAIRLKLKKPCVALPFGTSFLSQDLLPLLEQFDQIILWFSKDASSWEATKMFARKLGQERCSFVRMEPSTSSDTTSKPWCCILHVDVKQTKKQRQNVLSFGTTQWAAVQCAAQKRRSERNFEDSVYFNIVQNLPDEFPSESDNAGYHVQCYKNFTAVASSAPANKCESNVPAVSRRRSSAEPDHQPSTCTTDILQQVCLFCGKTRKLLKNSEVEYLGSCETFEACEKIQDAARKLNDENMLSKTLGTDLIAKEAKYHHSCKSAYLMSASRTANKEQAGGDEKDNPSSGRCATLDNI
ncbi:Twinkle protein, mitochondrial [Nymphon striatum]|nr:Twinkle protein, mitochondrial [Nymphon striatum]